jgi:16S rRNA (guanine1516-N2)-methyltransferase
VINLEKVAITTSQNRKNLIETAKRISAEIHINYIPRDNLSMEKIKQLHNLSHLLVVREDKIIMDEQYFFHPGMAIPRIKMLQKGETDPMVEAMDIGEGDSVLDCTLGMGNDSIVASFIVGSRGEITGLESSPIIYIVTKWGLATYSKGSKFSRVAMRNIKVINADYQVYLDNLAENSIDVIYFDPMFDIPLLKSNGINGLRVFANYEKITQKIIKKAVRVARKRIVIKDRKYGHLLQDLSVHEIIAGKSSKVKYGVYIK